MLNADNSIADPLKLQDFFLELMENFVTSLAYSLYEEAFSVFDKLLYLAGESVSENAIKKCIVALVDKYTLKSKSHKASMTTFMKTLMDVKVRRNQSPNISRAHLNQHQRNLSSPGSPEFDEMTLTRFPSAKAFLQVYSDPELAEFKGNGTTGVSLRWSYLTSEVLDPPI